MIYATAVEEGEYAPLVIDPANFERLESPTRRAFLKALPPLALAVIGFSEAGLVFASSCDTKPPAAHSDGSQKTKKSSMKGPQRGNGENPRLGG